MDFRFWYEQNMGPKSVYKWIISKQFSLKAVNYLHASVLAGLGVGC